MTGHLTLTQKEFDAESALFKTLEIKAEQVVGKDYQALSEFLKEQHRKLILVNHPDKGGTKERFHKIHQAYQCLQQYIKPLKSGNPCVTVSVDAESSGCLTAHEFHYRKKLFDALNIGKEAIGKDFAQLTSMLRKKDSSLDIDIALLPTYKTYDTRKYNELLSKPSIQLYSYINPLNENKNLIKKDKQNLALRLIERKDALLFAPEKSVVPLNLSAVIIIACYSPLLWIIPLNIIITQAAIFLVNYYAEKYTDKEISTDEFTSKLNYIILGSKLLIAYPMAAFSVYLLTKNFIDNGLTTDIAILGSLLLLTIFIEVLVTSFSKGCEIYAEKHTKDLLEEDPKDRVQKETDLLNWYDPRKLLMLFIIPLVKKCFAELENEFAERNFDEVKTDVSDVNINQHLKAQPLAI